MPIYVREKEVESGLNSQGYFSVDNATPVYRDLWQKGTAKYANYSPKAYEFFDLDSSTKPALTSNNRIVDIDVEKKYNNYN